MNYNILMIKLQIAEINRQRELKRLAYIQSLKGAK